MHSCKEISKNVTVGTLVIKVVAAQMRVTRKSSHKSIPNVYTTFVVGKLYEKNQRSISSGVMKMIKVNVSGAGI